MNSVAKATLHCLAKGAPDFAGSDLYLLPLAVTTASMATLAILAHQFESVLRSDPGSTRLQGVKNIIFACRLSKFAALFIVFSALNYQINQGISNGCLENSEYSIRRTNQ